MKSVVVTGVSSGIGLACAREMIAQGWRVFAGVRRSEDAERLKAELGERLVPIRFDVTDEAAVVAAADRVRTILNGETLFGLVNNAGIAVAGPLLHVAPADFRRQIETNLVGPFLVARAFVPLLAGDRPGRIVTVTSVAGTNALPFNGAYSAAKFGLEGLAAALRRELIVYGIKAVVVAPGPVRSAIWAKTAKIDFSTLVGTPYEKPGRKALAMMAEAARTALPTECAAKAIFRALTTKRPKAHYLLTGSPLGFYALKYLPARLADRLIALTLGLMAPSSNGHGDRP